MDVFVNLITQLQANDNDIRNAACETYEKALVKDPNSVVNHLVALLVAKEDSTDILQARNYAGVLFHKVILGGESFQWKDNLSEETKLFTTSSLLEALERETNYKLCRRLAVCTNQVATAIDRSGGAFWPALLPTLFRIIRQGSEPQQTAGIECVSLCINIKPVKEMLQQNPKEFGEIIDLSFKAPSPQIRKEGCILVCTLIEKWKEDQIKILEVTLGPMLSILVNLANEGHHIETAEILEQLEASISRKPKFFKPIFSTLIDTLHEFVMLRAVIPDDLRRLALELIISYTESGKDICLDRSRMPNFPLVALTCCMEMMCDITDDDGWSARMDDEEDDEDQQEFSAGEKGIDQIVENLTIEHCQSALLELIQQYVTQDGWEAKHAALSCIRQCIEYVEDKKIVDQMADLLYQHTENLNKRLRYVAWLSLTQLSSDQAPHFQENWHERLMPSIVRSMEHDPEIRVQQMCLSCFVSFGEELDNTDMETYAHPMMEKLVSKIMSVTHRGVREEAITSIAVIAGVIEKDFEQYYAPCLHILKDCIVNCNGVKESRLRGKAFECMSLLGHAVEPERFRADAQEVLGVMCKTYQDLDVANIQKDYIKEAMERVCRILKTDFSPYLKFVVPPLLDAINIQKYISDETTLHHQDEDDDDYDEGNEPGMTITYNDELYVITEDQLAEMELAIDQLSAMIEETGAGFFPEIEKTAAMLDPWLNPPLEVMLTSIADRVREKLFECWSGMVKDCALAAKKPDVSQVAVKHGNDILRRFLKTVAESWASRMNQILTTKAKVDPDDVKLYGVGLANCIKGGVRLNGLSDDEISGLIDLTFRMMELIRSEQRVGRQKRGVDDEGHCNFEEELHEANLACEDLLAGLMEYDPAAFQRHALKPLSELMHSLDTTVADHSEAAGNDRLLMLSFATDLVEHLGEESLPFWPIFMMRVMNSLHDGDADMRKAAACVVSLCARRSQFSEMASNAHAKIVEAITGKIKFPKRRDDSSLMAMDSMVAALLQLLIHHENACTPESWDYVLKHLPLQTDTVEAGKVHADILRLLKSQHASLLGRPGSTAKVIGILAEVYNDGKKPLNDDIRATFLQIPTATLQGMASDFSKKHKKKIQRVINGV